ncbi:secondary thiamine-phosphate synthase enzyme YjbQ [Carboxylicivirga sp. N1Y90]|uniref:secondary thiamine-phosphate synthase enzyme YjbQ n=1 Tax=Carboxylicivirga fragile TaxID=3417571 RepID=UPI003D3589C3|nr:YjbQ family protein [Marinilabiliaceae bacterium N1Y90]
MVDQYEIVLKEYGRGFHLITNEVLSHLPTLPEKGIMQVFIKHTSAGITLNENADSTVRADFETVFNKLVPEIGVDYKHVDEGLDDMPAHIKASLIGSSITIPISNGRLNIGLWQGIYLGEFRNYGGRRRLVLTICY